MKKIFLFLLPVFCVLSCGKGPETVTVQSDPSDLFTGPDTTFTATDTTEEDFVHIKLGEIAKIESLDPLFANSNSEWRSINLIYDGLVKLDENGNPAPNLAKRWEVNSDSTRFTFHLKTTQFFHDSPVFEGGTGRKFKAQDIRYLFERMASNEVPDFTANHFTDIRGFSAYHNERSFVKNPEKRVYKTIEGINIQNDSTVIFLTNKSASDFLHRLAHPMASVYARESVISENAPIQQAAGTGPFRFIKKEGNAHLLTIHKNYSGKIPAINRLDIISGLSEKNLFQEFARKNIDGLIEVGPSTVLTIADSSGKLLEDFYKNYDLRKSSTSSDYRFYYHKNSEQARQVNTFISQFDSDSLLQTSALGTLTVQKVDSTPADNGGSNFIITHSEHVAELFLIDKLASQATEENFSFSMSASYAPSDEVTFTLRPFPETQEFLHWRLPIYVLTHDTVSGIKIDHKPWNLDLSALKRSGGKR